MISPDIVEKLQALAQSHGLTVREVDNGRPWGGEFIFDDQQVSQFLTA